MSVGQEGEDDEAKKLEQSKDSIPVGMSFAACLSPASPSEKRSASEKDDIGKGEFCARLFAGSDGVHNSGKLERQV